MYNRPPLAARHVETGREMACPAGAPHARNGDQCTIRRVSALGGQLSLGVHLICGMTGVAGDCLCPSQGGGQFWRILHQMSKEEDCADCTANFSLGGPYFGWA